MRELHVRSTVRTSPRECPRDLPHVSCTLNHPSPKHRNLFDVVNVGQDPQVQRTVSWRLQLSLKLSRNSWAMPSNGTCPICSSSQDVLDTCWPVHSFYCSMHNPKIDSARLAELAGYKNSQTASACWSPLKKKLATKGKLVLTPGDHKMLPIAFKCMGDIKVRSNLFRVRQITIPSSVALKLPRIFVMST